MRALEFLDSDPAEALVVATIAMSISVKTLNKVEEIAGEAWDLTQYEQYINTGKCASRMSPETRQALQDQAYARASALLEDPASGMQCCPTPALGDLQVWGFSCSAPPCAPWSS